MRANLNAGKPECGLVMRALESGVPGTVSA
jgi:hypothetical protein